MFVIEISGKYIAAIFQSEKDVNSYLMKMRNHVNFPIHKVHKLSGFSYPFYILETGTNPQISFSFHQDPNSLYQSSTNLKGIHYTIHSDYAPKSNGGDEMGRLDHSHF